MCIRDRPEPGGAITDAVKRFWKHGLFSDVKILATKIEGDQVWLEIQLKQRPRISEVNYHGIKKGEREDLEARLGLRKGYQVTPNLIDRATTLIKKFFDGKGFKNVDVEIFQKDDIAHEGEVIVDININKNEKTKIHKIHFEGNSALTDRDLKKAMKKTNEKFSLFNDWKSSILEAFSTKKFTTEEYENDKMCIRDRTRSTHVARGGYRSRDGCAGRRGPCLESCFYDFPDTETSLCLSEMGPERRWVYGYPEGRCFCAFGAFVFCRDSPKGSSASFRSGGYYGPVSYTHLAVYKRQTALTSERTKLRR